ncbi:MAG: ATP-binding protein [Methyloligella sp.]|nr:MAG: ATP-binding protein [Methyloligella sp.]
MAPPRSTLQNIHLTFGGNPILTGAEMCIFEGDRICLVGRNGCGKSTFLKIAAGLIEMDDGERFVQPGTTMQYLEQEPDLTKFETTGDYARSGLVSEEDAYQADYYLEQLGLTGKEGTAQLSGGEQRRAALAKALAPAPDILLLDEPTNHLDLPAIEWLEKELRSLNSALVVISHDRKFLEMVSKSVLWIDRGTSRLMKQGFEKFEAWRDEVFEQEELEAHKLDRKIVAEEHWLRYGVTARRKRNQKRLGDLHSLRQKRRDHRGPKGSVKMETSEGRVSGKIVVEAKNISKSFGDTQIVNELSVRLLRGDRLGIVGPNGAGKSTIIKMLTGQLEPDAGEIKLGTNIDMVTLDQSRESLKPNWTLADALTNGGGDMVEVAGKPKHVIGYMKDFLFDPAQARTPLDVLSGGERARVMLARALSLPSNLMVLDEPTNDLDLETLDLLQELITDYDGTVLLVSHDRDFIDRIVDAVLVYEGQGNWTEYAGGYSTMMAQRKDEMKNRSVQAGEKPAKSKLSDNEASGEHSQQKTAKKGAKLSYKDKYALETLPKQIEELEAQIAVHNKALEDPDLFTKNPTRFNEAMEGISALTAEHQAAEERWLELEMMREEIEG